MRQIVIIATIMSLVCSRAMPKRQNKKWGYKLDASTATVAEDEKEIEKGEKAAKEKDEVTLKDVFDFLAGDDGLIQDSELTEMLTAVASDPESGLPQEMVMPIVEFVGFFVPEYAQCTMDWEMNFDDFVQMVEMFESPEPHPDMEEAMVFSMVDADNACTIDETEATDALMQMGVPTDQMGPIMEVLGQFAGEDELMTFDEFKGAYAALTGPGPDGPGGPAAKKMKLRSKRFSIKKRHMIRKLLKVLKSQAA